MEPEALLRPRRWPGWVSAKLDSHRPLAVVLPHPPRCPGPAASGLCPAGGGCTPGAVGASRLSTCFQSLLQGETPGTGNGATEEPAELPLAGATPWVRDWLGRRGPHTGLTPQQCEGGG